MKISILIKISFVFLFFCLSCEQSSKDSQQASLMPSNALNEVKNTKIKEKRFDFPQKDSSNFVFYVNHYQSKNDLNQQKQAELLNFKETLKTDLKLDFKIKSYNKYFNIAYRCTEAQVQALEYVSSIFFRDTYAKYFLYEPQNPFQIVYFATKAEFQQYTKSDAYGFYRPSEKTLYTYTGSGEGTLWHELMHAFMYTNITHDTQQWFTEGFASFYEMAAIQNNKFVEGYTNWRLPLLQKMLKNKDNLPLRAFLEQEDMSEDNAYAKARFLFCYLWIYDKIIPFSKSYLYELSAKYKGKELAQKSIEKMEELVGKKFPEIEAEYNKMAFEYVAYQKMQVKKVK